MPFLCTPIKGSSTTTSGVLNNANAIVSDFNYDTYGNRTVENILKEDGTLLRAVTKTYGPINGVSGLYVTSVEAGIGGEKRVAEFEYDYDTGLRTLIRDKDNSLTQTFTYDVYGQPRNMSTAGLLQSQRDIDYQLLETFDRDDAQTTGDLAAQVTTRFDALGRVSYTKQRESDPTEWVFSKRAYLRENSTGERVLTSMPYRSDSVTTMPLGLGWNCEVLDQAGRVIKRMSYSGTEAAATGLCQASTPASSTDKMVEISYGGGTTLTGVARMVETKEYNTGKKRDGTESGLSIVRRLYDALDRLVEVHEVLDGTETTTARYSYDPMGNLVEVIQGGQTRTFTYRSSSRLQTALNPESGTMTYAYERDGSMKSKSDAVASPRVSYGYDTLGRLTSKTFSGAEAASTVTQTYWQAADAGAVGKIGRLKRVERTGVGWTEYAGYDALGRVLTLNQSVSGAPQAQYGLQYQYFANGAMKQMTYPAPGNRVVKYELDVIGRPVKVCGATCTPVSPEKNYAEIAAVGGGTGYAPHGAMARVTLGNGVVETSGFNQYLQLRQHSAVGGSASLQITLGYATAGKNNGNIISQQIVSGGLDLTTFYDYTERNQLKKGEEKPTAGGAATWSRAFDHDLYGNMWVTATTPSDPDATIPQSQSWFDPANNRLTSTYAGYNAIGEMTSQGGWAYGYSAEGQMLTATASGVTRTNTYDGLGRRVKVEVSGGGGTTYFVYGVDGGLVAEYGALAAGTPGRQYVTSDWLGSTRMVTDTSAAVVARRDYLPFGQFVDASIGGRGALYSATGPRQMFTGKERDAETGLDYFGARYMASAQGRFTSPDAPFADQNTGHPQSWNLYAYVRNNPIKNRDPDGRVCIFGLGNTCDSSAPPSPTAPPPPAGWAATGFSTLLINDSNLRSNYIVDAKGTVLEKGRWSAVRAQARASTRSNQSGIADGLTAVVDAKDAAAVEAGTRQKGFTGTKTNTVVNALGSAIGKAGTGLAVVGVATSVYNVATAPEGNRGQVAAGEVGATLFGAASAWAGAKAGAGIGSYFGPWGTVGGGVLGGLGGAYFGGGAGQQVAKEAYDAVH